MVIDSIQTLFTEVLQSAPGSVSQVRETAALLVRFAKQTGISIILVGHVTKEGALAGPRVLEHMVDTVLYFEGDSGSRFRLVRAIKNRFGPVNEIGVFAMQDDGLHEVSNPSAMFLGRNETLSPGSVVLATQEGTRSLLVEVQALVDESQLSNPRRLCVGLDGSRLAMVLAVLHRHADLQIAGHDVFVNVTGGVRVLEPASDLAVALAIFSSFRDHTLSKEVAVFGELGLTGEVRPVQRGDQRIREAIKLGFTSVMIPEGNMPRKKEKDIRLIPLKHVREIQDIF
jgi:DNA repair protein RadA/Sms